MGPRAPVDEQPQVLHVAEELQGAQHARHAEDAQHHDDGATGAGLVVLRAVPLASVAVAGAALRGVACVSDMQGVLAGVQVVWGRCPDPTVRRGHWEHLHRERTRVPRKGPRAPEDMFEEEQLQ